MFVSHIYNTNNLLVSTYFSNHIVINDIPNELEKINT
jgi:hypothetical protein